jgi:hypothetical protein
MCIYLPNLFIKNPFLYYLHNNLIELLVCRTEILKPFSTVKYNNVKDFCLFTSLQNPQL